MTEIVSVKFRNKGKSYYFAPDGHTLRTGDTVVVETSKGLELADCCSGNKMVEDEQVVQPLRPVVRIATEEDLRVAECNKKREREAFLICQQQIEEHGLDMKLVDVECSFEGNKTTFFFTSDGRVDFRDLVKDLAGIFRNRIELRQIGVRDEAKMLGGIGICGRPYCCSQFLDDFQPVSTKMAKNQSLSLNPAKISGSCGRLMCCLRYEQEAYEDLVKTVPKQGAFVETKDGYGVAVQVNLLRQQVKVKLDDDGDNSFHIYKPNELAAVPGGRPREGEPLPSVLNYVPVSEEPEEKEDEWANIPTLVAEPAAQETEPEGDAENKRPRRNRHRRGRGNGSGKNAEKQQPAEKKPVQESEKPRKEKPSSNKNQKKPSGEKKEDSSESGQKSNRQHVKVKEVSGGKSAEAKQKNPSEPKASAEPKPKAQSEGGAGGEQAAKKKKNNRRRYYHNSKPKNGGQQTPQG